MQADFVVGGMVIKLDIKNQGYKVFEKYTSFGKRLDPLLPILANCIRSRTPHIT